MTVARLILLAVLLLAVGPGTLPGDDQMTAADEAALKKAGLKTDGPDLLEFFRKLTPTPAEQERLAQTVRRLGDPDFVVREKASADLLAAGRSALSFLRPAVHDTDLEIVRRAEQCIRQIEDTATTSLTQAAVRLLVVRRPAGTGAALLNYAPFVDDEGIEDEVLTALVRVGSAEAGFAATLTDALNDRASARRAAAAFVLGRSADIEQRKAVHRLLADAEPKVRLRAAQGLLAGKDTTAIPALTALLNEAPLPLAQQAEDLLCRIAGERVPSTSLGSTKTDRNKCRDVWTGWWRENSGRIDLAKVDLEQSALGLTMICACDGYNNGRGRIWEVSRDGQTRWEINNANYPVDAQVVRGNRVLIAEQSGRKLTERDFKGNIVWEHAVQDSLVSCQRLPNGNTLICCYQGRRAVEVDRAGKVVWEQPMNGGPLQTLRR
jgi:hypothetical protein